MLIINGFGPIKDKPIPRTRDKYIHVKYHDKIKREIHNKGVFGYHVDF